MNHLQNYRMHLNQLLNYTETPNLGNLHDHTRFDLY